MPSLAMSLRAAAGAAALLIFAAPTPSDGLMFHSLAVTKEWDTWVFVENGASACCASACLRQCLGLRGS